MGDTDAEIRQVCAILERVATDFAPASDEALAIRDAALAYIVVHQRRDLRQNYAKLRAALGGSLTGELKDDLKRREINADELED